MPLAEPDLQAAGNPDSTDGECEILQVLFVSIFFVLKLHSNIERIAPHLAHLVSYQAVSELPQPNRETMAFIMLHLQKVCLRLHSIFKSFVSMSALIVDAFLLSGGSSQRDEDELEQPGKDPRANDYWV